MHLAYLYVRHSHQLGLREREIECNEYQPWCQAPDQPQLHEAGVIVP